MCGIAGYYCTGEYDRRLDIAFPILGLYMQSRGRQSWGWTNGEQIAKDTGPLEEGFSPALTGYKMAALHTRQSTHGSVTVDNCHPWKFGDLIGMHNGIIRNHYDLNRELKRGFNVDSMHIFQHIIENRDLGELEGYGAVVFFKDGKVHLGRFNNGDMTVARTEFGWVFASTKEVIKRAFMLAGITKDVVYIKLKEDKLYRIDDDSLIHMKDVKFRFGTYKKTWERWDDSPSTYSSGNNYPYRGHSNSTGYVSNSGYQAAKDTTDKSKEIVVNDKRRDFGDGGYDPRILKADPPKVTIIKTTEEKTDEEVGRMIDRALRHHASNNEDVLPDETDAWQCGYCYHDLTFQDGFHLTDNGEMLCPNCFVRYPEHTIDGGPFFEFPKDIYTVAAAFGGGPGGHLPKDIKPEDLTMDCEQCGDTMTYSETVVHTHDNLYICLNCFAYNLTDSSVAMSERDELDQAAADFKEAMARDDKEDREPHGALTKRFP